MRVLPAGEAAIGEAVNVLRAGGLVVCPTMTNYVVVCDAANREAVKRVFAVKRRTKLGPLPISVRDVDQFLEIGEVPPSLDANLLRSMWPSELAVIVKQRFPFPPELTCGIMTIACSQSRHPVAAALQAAYDLPLAASSANISGVTVRVVTLEIAKEQLGESVDLYVDDGPTPGEQLADQTIANSIVDLSFDVPIVCRLGTFPLDQMRALVPGAVYDPIRYQELLEQRAAVRPLTAPG